MLQGASSPKRLRRVTMQHVRGQIYAPREGSKATAKAANRAQRVPGKAEPGTGVLNKPQGAMSWGANGAANMPRRRQDVIVRGGSRVEGEGGMQAPNMPEFLHATLHASSRQFKRPSFCIVQHRKACARIVEVSGKTTPEDMLLELTVGEAPNFGDTVRGGKLLGLRRSSVRCST